MATFGSLPLFLIYTVSNLLVLLLATIYLWIPVLPQSVKDLLLYGKAHGKRKEKTFVQKYLEIPKKWFLYFYIYGFVISLYLVYISTMIYIGGHELKNLYCGHLFELLFKSLETSNKVTTEWLGAWIVLCLILFQLSRRTYECIFISVYSDSTINIFHFLLALIFYGLMGLTVLSEAPRLYITGASYTFEVVSYVMWLKYCIGIGIFCYASYYHHLAHVTFRDIRSGKSANQHLIPYGHLFEYISTPHYAMEIVIYFAYQLILGADHLSFWGVTLLTAVNQSFAAYETHRWYRRTFRNYPPERKALIPLLF